MKVHRYYECGRCGLWYVSEKLAKACESQVDPVQVAKVGDFVTVRTHWIKNEAWVSNPYRRPNPSHGNCFDSCCNPLPYWVVCLVEVEQHKIERTSDVVEVKKHRLRYHLCTLAFGNDPVACYTHSSGHYGPVLASPQPQLDYPSEWLGKRAQVLL